MSKESVLFLCAHNAARRQMAEALLRKDAGVSVRRRGTSVAQVSKPAGSPISNRQGARSSAVSGFGNPRYSRLGSRRYEPWQKFREVRDQIESKILAWLANRL